MSDDPAQKKTSPQLGRPSITCEDTTWLVSDSCERTLTPEEHADLHDHIASCELCQGASTHFEVMFRQFKAYFAKTST